MTDHDSTADTLKHALRVAGLIGQPVKELIDRATCHDRSKTEEPELSVFNEFTPKLKTSTYGSDEYKGFLAAMGDALDHHYRSNRHHPEHFTDGINGMTLVDLIEMLADWKATTERYPDGSLDKNWDVRQERFGISDQLLRILHNTASRFGWLMEPGACGVRGKAPNGDELSCSDPANHRQDTHIDCLRDGLWWKPGELGGFEGGTWVGIPLPVGPPSRPS